MNAMIRRCSMLIAAGWALSSALAEPNPNPPPSSLSAALDGGEGHLVVEARGVPPPVPVFFSAVADETFTFGSTDVRGEAHVRIHVVQGHPELLTLGLSGDGEVVAVTGQGLRDWSVRRAAGADASRRFLDLRPSRDACADLDLTVQTRLAAPDIPGTAAPLLLGPGDAVGFSVTVNLVPSQGVDLSIAAQQGMELVGDGTAPLRMMASGEASLGVALSRTGAAVAQAELQGIRLEGRASASSVEFRLRGQLRAAKAGARLRILSGGGAPSGAAAGEGWHLELVNLGDGNSAYDLVAERVGVMEVDFPFVAAIRRRGDWQALAFGMPAGAVVPLRLEGVGEDVAFDGKEATVPVRTGGVWQGFLPADGRANLAWKAVRATDQGVLSFTGTEETDVRVGAGLVHASSRLDFRVLQGRLESVRLRLQGQGEVLGVEGPNVLGWKVVAEGDGRMLDVRFSRPLEAEGVLTVSSQSPLGAFPAQAEPMRLVPQGVVRHSGFVRVANQGSVRLEVTDAAGLMQLAPSQFPGSAAEPGARQVMVYRFPSSEYAYRVSATAIESEIAVSEIATYELSETDRVISANLELDVREAPIREWSIRIPDSYTVASVEGTGVSDYAAETSAEGGYRTLRISFSREVTARELLQLRLERNKPAEAGPWTLQPLLFPSAKSVRGHVGVVASAGFRIVPAAAGGLVEVPLGYFPRQVSGLQQAWRLRDAAWSASVRVEATGQSVQADVFHLYTVREGAVFASVLLNYFVVGAPVTEWRIEVPASAGNIDVAGQNVQRDWRREGNQVIVSLHEPALGASTLLVTFEQPMSSRGGVIEPGLVKPLGVQSERGYIEVASPLQVRCDVRKASGLLRLDPGELPAEYRLLNNTPALGVYQYSQRLFSLEMGVQWYPQAETADQAVDFASLSSHVSRDGQVVTEARYFVRNLGQKALRLTLPEGVRLWEARVDNEVTSAQVDGSMTVIPLPARVAGPVVVVLRLGQSAGHGSTVTLSAPRLASTAVEAEWVVRGDSGLQLVPRGGTAGLVRPPLTETGFEWIAQRHPRQAGILLGLVILGLLLLQAPSRLAGGGAAVVGASAIVLASVLATEALTQCRHNLAELTYCSSMVTEGGDVTVKVSDVTPARSLLVGWGLCALAAGAGAAPIAVLARRVAVRRVAAAVAASLVGAGVLAQHAGASAFFAVVGAAAIIGILVPGFSLWRQMSAGRLSAVGTGRAAQAGAVLLLLAFLGVAAPRLHAAEEANPAAGATSTRAAESILQDWVVRDGRLYADVDFKVRGVAGESFLLLREPAVLTAFLGDGLRAGKASAGGSTSYYAVLEKDGHLSGHARFEMALGEMTKGVPVPTGPAAVQRITVSIEQGGWEFGSAQAVQVVAQASAADNRSAATLVLGGGSDPRITLSPRRRDPAAETAEFYAEAANLYVPGPGVVDGYVRVTVKPVQGRVSGLDLEIPSGFTVGDVHGPVGRWRFDPEKHRLHVGVEPAQERAFGIEVQIQRGAGALPFGASLEPVRIVGSLGDVGTMALAFGPDAQPEGVSASNVSAINVQDFDAGLMPKGRRDQTQATVERVWRYGGPGARVELRVAPVAPEIRVTSRQVLSLDDDRLLVAADLRVAVARAGVFKLSFVLPEGMDVEALSGPALAQWTEARSEGGRIVTLQLTGRTLGETTFALTLAGTAPRPQDAWTVPAVRIREATRQSGDVLLVPGRGLRLRTVDREDATQVEPAAAGGLQPGTLAFHVLESGWSLKVGIEALDPWVTVQALEEVAFREGQMAARLAVRLRVENAPVKGLRIRLPGLDATGAATVRASGPSVSDMVRVEGSADLWDVRLKRGIVGETDIEIEFQGASGRDSGREAVRAPEFPTARQSALFVALRGGGRLELTPEGSPKGWTRADWASVAEPLKSRADGSAPALCFRVAEPEAPLEIRVQRHDIADSLKLRVTQADLMTVFSPDGASLTAVDLKVSVLEKGGLRVRLPAAARLYGAFVNAVAVPVVRDGDEYLLIVAASSDEDPTVPVRVVYSAPAEGGGRVGLVGPSLNVPLQNVSWRVLLPAGYSLRSYTGDLLLSGQRQADFEGASRYLRVVEQKRSEEAQKAVSLLEQADSFLQSGDQQRAGAMLSRASNAQLDPASNEDARVQLRNLRTQQTLLSLNTRRQRLYLDNRGDGARNQQLEQAARLNPLMSGKVNFDPQQVDQLLMGNSESENAALGGIASRLVDQQLSGDVSPGAVDLTLPERGRVLTFTRSLQVDGGSPLALRLGLGRSTTEYLGFGCALVAILGTIGGSLGIRRAAAPAAKP